MTKNKPEKCSIEIPDAELIELRNRLQQWRKVEDFANQDWRYGANGDYLEELIDYWSVQYDWRSHEAAMNRFDHFKVEIEGVPIHFMYVPGKGPKSIPMIMTHGWPWTFWDFHKIIGPLTDPLAHGGNPDDSFDLIIPSLPGFGFSSPLRQTGIGFARTAELWDVLMHDILGYQRYAAQGGDWGSLVTAALGHLVPEHLIGVHESMGGFLGLDYQNIPAEDYAPEEQGFTEWLAEHSKEHVSHMAVHTADPQSLAYALNDSPVGLAAWIVERRRAWSDCGGDVEKVFSKDDLLTTLSLYWHTNTIGSSMRFYWESMHGAVWQPRHDSVPTVPTPSGFAVFPRDSVLVPRKTAERYANVQHWNLMPRGGHFSPMEQPELLTDDIRTFFRALR